MRLGWNAAVGAGMVLVAWCAGVACAQEATKPAVPIADQIGLGNREGAIPLEPNRRVLVEKVPVADCRVVRGFLHYPADGRLDSRHYNGNIAEYGAMFGDGVHYEYNNNDGLHVRLADEKGFDAVIVRGGYQGKIYRDANALDGPGDAGVLLADVASKNNVFRAAFPQRVTAKTIDFYQPKRAGTVADLSFLRVTRNAPAFAGVRALACPVTEKVERGNQIFLPLHDWISFRFGGPAVMRMAGDGPAAPVELKPAEFLHVGVRRAELTEGLAAISLSLKVAQAVPGSLLTVRVQDPLDFRRELMGADFTLAGPGDYEVTLDIPDQVLVPNEKGYAPVLEWPYASGAGLWLSLAADAPVAMANVTITAHAESREQSLPQALAWRKFLLKGLFYQMSEPRPWMNISPETNIREWINTVQGGRYKLGLAELFETVEQARMLAPQDDLVRQYCEWLYQRKKPLGEWKAKLPEAPGVPRWALLAHEAYLAVSAVPRWWAENRMAPNGTLGGWVGDDSDMYQTWHSFPYIEDKPLGEMLYRGAEGLCEPALARHLEKGLNRKTTDPLHAYEEGVNHLALCARWFYGDPVHFERCMESAASVPKLTILGEDGRRHFHGQRVGAPDLKEMGPIDTDGVCHPLFLHPVYEVAWYNRNPEAVKFYSDWADTWIAYQTPEHWVTSVDAKTGKLLADPATGAIKGTDSRPGRGGYESQGDAWFGIYHVTGDPRFLKPYFTAFDAGVFGFKTWNQWPNFVTAPAFADKLDLFKQKAGGGYAGFLLTGNKALIEAGLEAALSEMQRFPDMQTTAEPFTDRVFSEQFAAVACAYLGSYSTRNKFTHYQAVTWEGLGHDFAALVSLIRSDALRVSLYNFAEKPLAGRMRVWRLDHGRYSVKLGPDANDDLRIDQVERESVMELYRHAPVEITLAPRRTTVVEIAQLEKLDDILDRADLALSRLDTVRNADGTVNVKVHNIGAKAAANIAVVLFRDGKKVASQQIASLDAPLDLAPRIASVTFTGAQAGDEIVLDPENRIPEINEENNRLRL